jgi:nitroreductase
MSQLSVTDAITQRISTRAFHRDRAVQLATLREIITLATRAPSGGNTQPWHVYVVGGAARDQLCQAAQAFVMSGGLATAAEEFAMYPSKHSTPPAPPSFIERRRALGYAMYSLMGVDRKDKAGRAAAMGKNWDFFGAPVGIIVTVERSVDRNGWGHVGGLLQSICLLAEERGLATCLQEAWANMGRTVYDQLNIPENEIVWCGISLGYADKAAPVNTLKSDRAPLGEVAQFCGFDGPASKL